MFNRDSKEKLPLIDNEYPPAINSRFNTPNKMEGNSRFSNNIDNDNRFVSTSLFNTPNKSNMDSMFGMSSNNRFSSSQNLESKKNPFDNMLSANVTSSFGSLRETSGAFDLISRSGASNDFASTRTIETSLGSRTSSDDNSSGNSRFANHSERKDGYSRFA